MLLNLPGCVENALSEKGTSEQVSEVFVADVAE